MNNLHCKTLLTLWRNTADTWRRKEFKDVLEYERNKVISKIYDNCADRLEESIRLDEAEEPDDADSWKEDK